MQAQNAGVFFSKDENFVPVEVFELSPQNKAVVATLGCLSRTVPGRAIRIPLQISASQQFVESIAHTLAKMSHQGIAHTKSKSIKATHEHDEIRDITHPKMITELFFGFLQALGQAAEAPAIWKNTPDEVMYDNALVPWRRSPFWLLVRVSLQILMSRNTSQNSDTLYKTFMVFFYGTAYEANSSRSSIMTWSMLCRGRYLVAC